MVKKASFLEKLKNRWLPASGIHIDDVPGETTDRVQALTAGSFESLSSRKLSPKQEAVVAINEGFKELSSLLRGMHTRVDAQGEQLDAAVQGIVRLPALAEAQIDLMKGFVERLDRQNEMTAELAQRLGDVPHLIADVRSTLERAVASDQRTTRVLGEFESNMVRVQDSLGQLVEHSGRQAEAASAIASESRDLQERQTEAVRGMVEEFDRAHRTTLEGLRETTEQGVAGLQRVQDEQAASLTQLVDTSRRSQRAVVVLLVLTVAALIAIGVVLALR